MTMLVLLFAQCLGAGQEEPNQAHVDASWAKLKSIVSLVRERDQVTNFDSAYDRSKLRVKIDVNGHTAMFLGSRVHSILDNSGHILMLSTLTKIGEKSPPERSLWEGISREEAVTVARQIYSVLDADTSLNVQRIQDMGWRWEITAFPQTEPFPLGEGYECIFRIFKHKGQLQVAYLNYAPDLSAAQGQVRTENELRASAIDAYQRWKPFERAEVKGVKTVLLRPHYGAPNETTEEHFALAKANKVIPTFDMMIADADTVDPETGKFSRFQVVHVDARTGHALAIEPNELLGTSYSNLTPSEPDLKSASSLVVNEMSLDKIVLAKPKGRTPRPEWSGSSSVLLQGKSAWKCHPSRDGRFVRVGESVYTVGRQTWSALKKLLAKRSKPFAGDGRRKG